MGIIIRQSVKGTIVNYVGVAIGFITTFFILTKYLTTEEIGLVRVLTQSSLLFATFAQLGTNTSAIRYYPYFKDEESHDHGFFGWTLLVPLIGFAIFTVLFFIFKDTFCNIFAAKSQLFVKYIDFVLPLAFFMLYITVFETNSNLLLRIVVPKFTREVAIRVLTMVAYILYAFRILSLTGMVIALCAVYGIATLLNIFYLLRLKRVSFRIEKGYVKPELRHDFALYTLFLLASALTTELAPVLNDYFVAGMQGLASAGVFSIAVYVATVVEMPYRSLSAISRPHISQSIADGNIKKTNEICQSVSLNQFLIGSLIFFVIWANIDLFFSLLPNGEEFAAAKWVVFILGLSRLFNSTLNVGLTVLSYSKKYYFSLIFSILLTIISIFLNYKLLPLWGMEGAAIATLTAYLVYYIALIAFVRYKIGVNPLTMRHISVIAIIIAMFGLALLWDLSITRLLVGEIGSSLVMMTIDGLLKTAAICVVGVLVAYKTKLSLPFNSIIDKVLHAVRLK